MPSGDFHSKPGRSTRNGGRLDRTGTPVSTWTLDLENIFLPPGHLQAGGITKLSIPSSARWGGLGRLRGVCCSQRASPLKGSSTGIAPFCCRAAAGLRGCTTLISDHQWLLAYRHSHRDIQPDMLPKEACITLTLHHKRSLDGPSSMSMPEELDNIRPRSH